MAYRSFRDLIVWQRAMDLVVSVYDVTQQFPADERFGLTSQMRRAAVSIPSNIAEGHGRRSEKEFMNFLWIANGSLSELQTQTILARRLEFLSSEHSAAVLNECEEVGRLLTGLRNSVKTN